MNWRSAKKIKINKLRGGGVYTCFDKFMDFKKTSENIGVEENGPKSKLHAKSLTKKLGIYMELPIYVKIETDKLKKPSS